VRTTLDRLANEKRSVPSHPPFESMECALTALDALAARKYVRSRPARSQEQADRWLKDQAAFLSEGLDVAAWDEADSPLLAAALDAVERFQAAFLRWTSMDEDTLVPADQQDADLQDGFELWFSGLRGRLAVSGISVSDEPCLDRCGVALEGHGVPHIGCVRTMIVLSSLVHKHLHPRLVRATRFVATLFFLEQIDKAAGGSSLPHRRIDAKALSEGSLAKVDGLWQVAQRLHSKG